MAHGWLAILSWMRHRGTEGLIAVIIAMLVVSPYSVGVAAEVAPSRAGRVAFEAVAKAKAQRDPTLLAEMKLALELYKKSIQGGKAPRWDEIGPDLSDARRKAKIEHNLLSSPPQFDWLEQGIDAGGTLARNMGEAQMAGRRLPPEDKRAERYVALGKTALEVSTKTGENYAKYRRGTAKYREAEKKFQSLGNEADAIVKEMADLSERDPRFREQVVEGHFGGDLNGASPRKNFAENLAADAELAQTHYAKKTYEMLQRSMRPDGSLNVNMTELQNNFRDFESDLRADIQKGTDAVKAEIAKGTDDVKKYIEKTEQAKAEEAKRLERQAALRQLKYEAAESSVFLMSGMARLLGNEERAVQIQTVGAATIQVAHSIEKFSDTINTISNVTGAVLGCINLVAGIGQAASMIMSLFVKTKSIDQMILEEVRGLRDQIENLQTNMNARFDQVDARLNEIFDAMDKGFHGVELMLTEANRGIDEVQSALAGIADAISRMETSTYYYLRAGFQQPIEETIDWCLADNPELSLRDFEECIVKFQTFATKHATNELATGTIAGFFGSRGESRYGPTEFYSILGQKLSSLLSIWDGISLVTWASEYQLGIPVMRRELVDPSNPAMGVRLPVANAEQWARYAELYAAFVSSHSDLIYFVPHRTRIATASILDAGATIDVVVKNLALNGRAGPVPPGSSVVPGIPKDACREWEDAEAPAKPIPVPPTGLTPIEKAIVQYEEMLRELKTSISVARDNYESEQLRGVALSGSGEALGSRLVDYDLNPLQPCDVSVMQGRPDAGEHPTTWQKFPSLEALPKGRVMETLPSQVRMAAQMGLGRIEACYDNLWWTFESRRLKKNDGNDNTGLRSCSHKKNDEMCMEFENFGHVTIGLVIKFVPYDQKRFNGLVESLEKAGAQVGALKPKDGISKIVVWKRTLVAPGPAVYYRMTWQPLTLAYKKRVFPRFARPGSTLYVAARGRRNDREDTEPRGPEEIDETVRYESYNWAVTDRNPGQFPPYRYEQISAHWPAIAAKFSSPDGPKVESDAVAVNAIYQLLENRLASARKSFSDHVVREMGQQGSGIQKAADAVTGSKRLMETLLAVAYPRALERSDEVRRFFYGDKSLMDRFQMEQQWTGIRVAELTGKPDTKVSPNFSLDPARKGNPYFLENCRRVQALKQRAAILAVEQAGKEFHPMVYNAKMKLELVQFLQGMMEGTVSVERALGELRSRLEAYRE